MALSGPNTPFSNYLPAGQRPYAFQLDVARRLLAGENLVLRAPTGCGKTLSVLVPFLEGWEQRRWRRLIYALPLRTLANGIYEEACKVAGDRCVVTLQTGERPDDPFFDRGDIIVCTYDQLLSGLLSSPYSLGPKQHNVNSACIAGALAVFDEFHLMEPGRAFLTAAACLHLFRDLCQSVWMTATATSPLLNVLASSLGATMAGPSTAEIAVLPCVARVERRLVVERAPLSAERVVACHRDQSLVVVNQVRWAQELFADLRKRSPNMPIRLLHSLFFQQDRKEQEQVLREWFGPEGRQEGIIVATQVIEAGIDITCSQEHTVVCPMNAFVQRAGRNVRFAPPAGELARGEVHVYPLPPGGRSHLPYPEVLVRKTWELLQQHDGTRLDPTLLQTWVEKVHQEVDLQELRGEWRPRLRECVNRIRHTSIDRTPGTVSDLIREVDGLYCILAEELPENPFRLDGLSIRREALRRLITRAQGVPGIWGYRPDDAQTLSWQPLDQPEDADGAIFAICLSPRWAKYDALEGLRLGEPGEQSSPGRELPERPGYASLKKEPWVAHSRAVAAESLRRVERELDANGLLAAGLKRRFGCDQALMLAAIRATGLLHDLAKLQHQWQQWLETYQRGKDPAHVHTCALAHSDYDARLYPDRELSRQTNEICRRRPPHAAPGALLSAFLLPGLLPAAHPQLLLSALGAITAHHGGWLGACPELGAGPLWSGWRAEVNQLLNKELPDATLLGMEQRLQASGKRDKLAGYLATVSGPDALEEFWPLLAYLTRTLRLSDQRATEEGSDVE